MHTQGRKHAYQESPAGNHLIAGYHAMLNTSRWQRSKGADFVFYDPHPGFTDGSVEKNYYTLICDTFQHAMHIVVERGQRNICQVPVANSNFESNSPELIFCAAPVVGRG